MSLEDLRLLFRLLTELWNQTHVIAPSFQAIREVRAEVAVQVLMKERQAK